MLFHMTLVERVTQDLTAAMKSQDAARTSALRMAKAALKNREIEKRGDLDDAEAVRVLQALVKQREDSIFQFRKANRPELVQKEEKELDVLKAYLPAEASEADIDQAVTKALAETGAATPKDMGKAMKAGHGRAAGGGKPRTARRSTTPSAGRLGA
jgi:uncharacterized protein YqeY